MNVILLQDVKALGKKGQVVKVSDGYAANYLLPNKLAKPATEGSMREHAHQEKVAGDKKQKEIEAARALAARMQETRIEVPARVGEGGKLYGAVTNQDVAGALQRCLSIQLDKRKVELKAPIKQLGEHKVTVKVYPQVNADITVHVVPSGE